LRMRKKHCRQFQGCESADSLVCNMVRLIGHHEAI
jgi:hypothetical protein